MTENRKTVLTLKNQILIIYHLFLSSLSSDCFIYKDPEAEDIQLAREGLQELKAVMASGDYPLVIRDEANIATFYRLFSVDELLQTVSDRAESVEVVIKGRKADPAVIEMADLVTEMKEVKHYYTEGVKARDGIEK